MEARVKATPVNGLVDFVSKDLTPEQFRQVLDNLPEEERRWFSGHVLAHELVPLGPVNRFTVLAAAAKGEPIQQFAHRAGRHGAEQGLKTVYKFVMMVLSPQAVLKKAPLMWTRVYDTGVIEVESENNSARVHLRDFPSEEAGCGRVTGWFELMGERSGARNLRIQHALCMARSDAECRWDIQWSD